MATKKVDAKKPEKKTKAQATPEERAKIEAKVAEIGTKLKTRLEKLTATKARAEARLARAAEAIEKAQKHAEQKIISTRAELDPKSRLQAKKAKLLARLARIEAEEAKLNA